jgi:hypothetical protein
MLRSALSLAQRTIEPGSGSTYGTARAFPHRQLAAEPAVEFVERGLTHVTVSTAAR